jgi:hypothetical protein
MRDADASTALPGGGRGNRRFRAIVVTAVPEAAALDGNGWHAVEAIIARALAMRPSGVRRQLGLFVRALDLLSLVRYGRPLSSISLGQRTALLEWLARSRVLALRRGVWGVRTLAFMGYYARPEASLEIGYRASPLGWETRRTAAAGR